MQENSNTGGQDATLFKRACDACRTRKVRCDKGSPCSACKASNISCRASVPHPKPRRKRVHVTEEYEKKIDRIQARLADLDHVLQPVDGVRNVKSVSSNSPSAGISQGSTSSYTSPYSINEDAEDETAVFAGGTSMRAHSAYAHELLEKAVRESSISTTNPEISSALASLRQAAGNSIGVDQLKQRSRPAVGSEARFDFRRLPLPPTDAVLDILRRAKDTPTLTFAFPFAFMNIASLTDLCKSVFFCVDNYPASTAVLVYGHLYYLFSEFSWTTTDEEEKTRFSKYVSICKQNLEISLWTMEILSSGSYNNISALVIGACWATDTCRPSMSWKLTAAAATLAQSMGWHRSGFMHEDNEEQRTLKTTTFWYIYALDKSLSLRLGRASTFQDYDIDIELPELEGGQSDPCILAVWARAGRVQGLVYEQLYSPAALKQSGSVRKQRAISLLEETQSVQNQLIQVKNSRANLPNPESAAAKLQRDVLEMLALSDEVVVQVVFTMIYRAIPPEDEQASGISEECLSAARVALEMHQKAVTEYRSLGDDCWSIYLHWTILHAPFIPFIVIFANVLHCSDTMDLHRLGKFAQSLGDGQFSEGATKMHNLCSTLYQVANLYLEVKRRKTQPEGMRNTSPLVEDPNNAINSQTWSALNPYFNTIGFAGDPALDSDAVMSNSLGDWVNGNRFIMGLLEDDILDFNVPQGVNM